MEPAKTERKLSNPITPYELAEIKTIRVVQLSEGDKPRCSHINANWTKEQIVEQEILENKLNLVIQRKSPSGKIELWNVQELPRVLR